MCGSRKKIRERETDRQTDRNVCTSDILVFIKDAEIDSDANSVRSFDSLNTSI